VRWRLDSQLRFTAPDAKLLIGKKIIAPLAKPALYFAPPHINTARQYQSNEKPISIRAVPKGSSYSDRSNKREASGARGGAFRICSMIGLVSKAELKRGKSLAADI
jgi:hypothetical protein